MDTRESNKSHFIIAKRMKVSLAMCAINHSPQPEREIIQDLCDATKKRCVHGQKIAFSLIKLNNCPSPDTATQAHLRIAFFFVSIAARERISFIPFMSHDFFFL